MTSDDIALTLERGGDDAWTPRWRDGDGAGLLEAPAPVVLELSEPGEDGLVERRVVRAYDAWTPTGEDGDGVAECVVEDPSGARLRVRDRWSREAPGSWRVDRALEVERAPRPIGVRLGLEVRTAHAGGCGPRDLRSFAPPALYDRNDHDDDGLEDFLDTDVLVYRDDRLSARSVLAYDEGRGLAFSIVRLDAPGFDSDPDRPARERTFWQRTDIGSLGLEPVAGPPPQMALVAHYPFVERDRCHALLLRERPGWGAHWPVAEGERLEVAYAIRVSAAPDVHEAAWSSFSERLRELEPRPTPLAAPLDELDRHRTDALMRYHVDRAPTHDAPGAAGFVTNCHPQDGRQLGDIIQWGFTGQNVLNAYNVVRSGRARGRDDLVRAGERTVEFFVDGAHMPETGLFHTYFNVDNGRMGSWWTGLLLPLAYAEPGQGLEELMGPLAEHMGPTIEQLQGQEGSYLRCMSEDVHALTLLLRDDPELRESHPEWLAAARRYGEFLLAAQDDDGGWFRAYDHDGRPLRGGWFGAGDIQQKSSTASAIPPLLELHGLTGDARFQDAAVRAGELVRRRYIDDIRSNGGVHDSVYARPQLIDSESILFPLRAMVDLGRALGDDAWWDGAQRAARLLASWIWLWDVPLPPTSTLARHGFRTTGWAGCDTAGAGYIHPFELYAVPDLVEIAGRTGDAALFDVAELVLHGCNQTVATPEHGWGYAFAGLQEEGYLISWWLIDDPIFVDTAFGGRGKGEGNKTCFPWIPAVAGAAYWGLLDRFGTLDLDELRERFGMAGAPATPS
jgi:hypothetical protein